MTKSLAALLACLALGLVAAGCGSSNNNKSSNSGGGAQTSTKTSSSGGTAAKTTSVSMKNLKFNPTTVSVPAGTTVKWTNDDSVGHDVTAATFKSGTPGGITAGASFSHTFAKAGTYKYVCTIHKASGMTGTVIVK